MKVSYNWIQEYLDFPLPPIDELVHKIGSQLGAVETVIDIGRRYQGIVVVKVASVRKLEDSDHLNVCLIDDGSVVVGVDRDENGLVQVVCGAPNVRAGITVAWLPPGSTVPSSFDKEPFVLGSRTLRGVVSNGMLASPQELAIGDNSDGILELEEQAPGSDFATSYGLDDHIIDVENKMFTHRPDCFGIIGVAREIAGILGKPFHEPHWFETFAKNLTPLAEPLPLTVRNEAPELVPRFMALVLSGLEIKPSDVKIQTYLSRVGVRPINNVVDATNYFMYLTGQPLHAYDYDKVRGLDGTGTATLVARQPLEQETLTLLNGKQITPRTGAVVIATVTQAIGLGGVMGGATTEVDAATKNIILECATFEMYSIRRTSMAHGIFSEAVTRFNKGQSPLQNDRILLAAARYICEHSQAAFASDIIDEVAPRLQVNRPTIGSVDVRLDFIGSRLGLSLTAESVVTLLSNVGFIIRATVEDGATLLQIGVPFWRTDIALPEDIVEEVGRLYGFDNVPLHLPRRSIEPASRNPLLAIKSRLRKALSCAGATEVLTYSFVHDKLLAAVGQDKALAYGLSNALSPDLQYYRLSLTPSLLDKVHANIRAGHAQLALFEIGKTHCIETVAEAKLPVENERLALVIASDHKAAKEFDGSPYFMAKYYLESLLQEFGQDQAIRYEPISDGSPEMVQARSMYQNGRSANVYIGDSMVGSVGEYRTAVRTALKLPDYCAGFEVDVPTLLQLSTAKKSRYRPLAKFPRLEQDLCLRVPIATEFSRVYQLAVDTMRTEVDDVTVVVISPLDIFQRPEDTAHKQITLRLSLTNYQRTLTEAEVSAHLDKLTQQAHYVLGAERI